MKKKLVEVVEIIEEEWLEFVEKLKLLPGTAVTEMEVFKRGGRTRRIVITRTKQIFGGSKGVFKFMGNLIISFLPIAISQYFCKFIMWIFRKLT